MKKKTGDRLKIIILIALLLAMIGITIYLLPQIRLLFSDEGREWLRSKIEQAGPLSALVFLGVQILQVVVAVLPGEPVELVGGLLFGTWGGLGLCLAGLLIGTVIVYYMVRVLGASFVDRVISSEKRKKLKILQDERRVEGLVFLLFLIPGTPKDTLTYLVPFTPIRPHRFFLYATVARIPSVVSSTLVGSNIGDGNWLLSVVIYAITGVIGLVGIWYNNRFLKRMENSSGDDNPETQQEEGAGE